ncbi:DUF1746-domain-containing protein [Aaosphaeria arxii CBS 175.79]|uniref:DUF1746-domain-containing protein n=1 Tax=Aaosphaeria arxii CBS 175.79 TaxID=1450172 RepID=A0A6A5X960_9PLEO|nr:DUF1746-domain-containing protein [Aaosphaeria arxii CBS 175.79]KAF2009294.1 DUF1746-domain-containing protein [Aaosphaeria arxii CBS 175.79]
MNDEAESSSAGLRHGDAPNSLVSPELDTIADPGDTREQERRTKERRSDAKKKRVVFLDQLLRELDTLVFLEFITLYHLDCSFFWFFVRSAIQLTVLTPLPDLQLSRQHDEHKPYMALILVHFGVTFTLHMMHAAPVAGEDTRGYLHGGLMIDFIGQKGPTSKWKLASLDICILLLQVVMVSVHVKRRGLKKTLAKIADGTTGAGRTEGAGHHTEGGTSGGSPGDGRREQDADAEERGVFRRTDSLSDIGIELDEEDTLLPSSPEIDHTDALDTLSSGQAVVGDFTLIDTLLQSHEDYQAHRHTHTDTGSSTSLSPTALRQLHTIRARFGVGG